MSCDLLPTDVPGPHYEGNVFDIINEGWDLMVCHPPCTFITGAGERWFYHPEDKHLPFDERRPHPAYPNRRKDREEALDFCLQLMNCSIPKIAMENPVGKLSTFYRKPDQIIQPWMFGHEEFKATCLWLKGLEPLVGTNVLTPPKSGTEEHKRWSKVHLMPPGPLRWKLRSKTYQGIADAMASQWG